MIIAENVTINGMEFVKTYSDEGRYVVREGIPYSEAIDPVGTGRIYEEGELMPEEEIDAINN